MPLTNIIIVLHQLQDAVNIGAVLRAMKNMGLRRLRLVAPVAFERAEVLRLAHRCEDILDATERYTDLDAALADTIYVVGTAAQRHSERPTTSDTRGLAPELLRRAADGPVALLFGPEDNGLDNHALDRCHLIVSLPTDPDYPALNLAQSALLLIYELRLAAQGLEMSDWRLAEPVTSNPVTSEELEQLFAAAETALHAIEFFKGRNPAVALRLLRQLTHRAELSRREAALLTAMAREVAAFVGRKEG